MTDPNTPCDVAYHEALTHMSHAARLLRKVKRTPADAAMLNMFARMHLAKARIAWHAMLAAVTAGHGHLRVASRRTVDGAHRPHLTLLTGYRRLADGSIGPTVAIPIVVPGRTYPHRRSAERKAREFARRTLRVVL